MRYSQVSAAGVADEHEHELVAERREDDVQRVELDRQVAGRRLLELGGQTRADVDDAGGLGGDGVDLDRLVGVGRDDEAVTRDEQGGEDPGGRPVRSQFLEQGVRLFAHDPSKAVVS